MSATAAHNVKIRLFGALREYGREITLPLPQGTGVADVRAMVKDHIKTQYPGTDAALVDDCAIADDTRILGEDETIGQDTYLALLPPVCGG